MSTLRKAVIGITGAGTLGGALILAKLVLAEDKHARRIELHCEKVKKGLIMKPRSPLLPRTNMMENLQNDEFDVLIIGGGATGAGCALDAATRGLKTAMVELDDFSSGTSSRSTKLIHGGVRYLQKAIMKLDYEQYSMVKEALHERANLLDIAPHLSFPLPIMLPVYKWWQVPYFWAGIKAYDFVSGDECLKSSYYLNKERALELFPMLKRERLKGAIVYYDGSHNDSRMNISIAITAARYGATIANHARVIGLVKDENGKINGVRMRDEMTGKEWITKTKCVINATGPFCDSIRKMDDPSNPDIVCPSAGIHIVLPDFYSPANMGLLDPSTSDGRIIFFLPWQGHTIAGTTDSKCEVTHNPSPSETDIQFILNEVRNYLTPDIEVRRGDVQSAWSGIRPLVKDPNKADTQNLVRNHVVHVSPSGLVTIAGGKWTTYRVMAMETIDKAVKEHDLPAASGSQTDGLILEGGHTWTPTMFIRLIQDLGMDSHVAKHLAETYGDKAFTVGKLATLTGQRWPIVGKKLHDDYPYIEAEVRYACREYATTAIDVIFKRLRISFLNVQAAEEILPRVIEIMSEELKWNKDEKKRQLDASIEFLKTEMGKDVNKASRESIPINLSKQEIGAFVKKFSALDTDKKGFVSVNDIRNSLNVTDDNDIGKIFTRVLTELEFSFSGVVTLEDYIQRAGQHLSGEEMHNILKEIDTNNNGKVEIDEYLQMMSAIKTGAISHSRFAHLTDIDSEYGKTLERSGGGV